MKRVWIRCRLAGVRRSGWMRVLLSWSMSMSLNTAISISINTLSIRSGDHSFCISWIIPSSSHSSPQYPLSPLLDVKVTNFFSLSISLLSINLGERKEICLVAFVIYWLTLDIRWVFFLGYTYSACVYSWGQDHCTV